MSFISICIPAYERAHYLRRLLDSICIQDYKDFEVVLSDDSRTEAVRELCAGYAGRLPIRYFRNQPALGTPANWNAAMAASSGRWIKLMHDDDWFASPSALGKLARIAAADSRLEFIWCSYSAVYDTGKSEAMFRNIDAQQIIGNPYVLFANNLIGPPSNVLVRADLAGDYDARFKWLVDIDYYMRKIRPGHAFYLKEPLINIGYNDSRVTETCLGNREIEIPEALRLFARHGFALTRGLRLYNAWWRLIRNLDIRDESQFAAHAGGQPVPGFLQGIIRTQARIPQRMLKRHAVSFLLMSCHYLLSFLPSKK